MPEGCCESWRADGCGYLLGSFEFVDVDVVEKNNWQCFKFDVVDVGCSCSEQLHCNFVPDKYRQRIGCPLSRIAEKRIFRHWQTKAFSSTGRPFSSVECVGMRLVPRPFVTTKSVFHYERNTFPDGLMANNTINLTNGWIWNMACASPGLSWLEYSDTFFYDYTNIHPLRLCGAPEFEV
ncbi:hypothetical protein J3E69DRAFT_90040 [Trichoderma sp. SZMC 28015]